jgi:hypothetical protein
MNIGRSRCRSHYWLSLPLLPSCQQETLLIMQVGNLIVK